MSAPELPADTRRILDETVRDLEQTRLSGSSKLVARTVLKSLKAARGHTDVIAQVQRLEREVSGIATVLSTCETRLRDAEYAEADRDPDGAAWWTLRRRRVVSAFGVGDAGARDLWVATWLEALERDAWARCDEIAGLREVPAEQSVTAEALRAVARALAEGDPPSALAPLEALLDSDAGGGEAQPLLGLLHVRILLRDFSDRARVRAAAQRVAERAAGGHGESVALAALAEERLANDDVRTARTSLDKAVALPAPATDALVLLGEVHEREAAWAEADRCYDDALAADPRAAVPALLRRVPARLLVRAAARRGIDPGTAVELLDRALDLGLPGDGDYPDKDVWVARGDHLRARARSETPEDAARTTAEAAASYFQGGLRYSWSGYLPRAIELFGVACELDPDVAEYAWQQAEALRLAAYRSDGVIDRKRLLRAREQLESGLRLREPTPQEAWVFVTQSRVEEDLGTDVDPAVPLERALLLDPDYELGYVFLAASLRKQGWPSEAEDAMRQEASRTATDEWFAFITRLDLSVDRGDDDAALELLADRAEGWPDDPMVTIQRASALMVAGQFPAALEAVHDDGSEMGRLLRALALARTGHADDAREEYRALWQDTRSAPTQDIAGWAAFGAGMVDEGIARYRELADRAPADLPYRRDLGQMLLVRGDVEEGRAALEQGVDACPYARELRHLLVVELPVVRTTVAGAPHEAEVVRVLAALERRVDARLHELRHRRRSDGSVAVTAASARSALHAGEFLDALRTYHRLARATGIPEAGRGAALAAAGAREDADRAYVGGDHAGARERWRAAEHGVAGLEGCDDVVRALVARRLVTDLVDRPRPVVDGWRTRDLDLDDPAALEALEQAVDVLVRDPASLWTLRDSLARLHDEAGVSPEVQVVATALAARLPLARTYGLDAEDAVTYPSFLSVKQLEIRLGSAVARHLADHELDRAVTDLQERLQSEVGVRVPWVYHRVAPELAPAQVDHRVYGRWVATEMLDGDPDTWLERLMRGLERTVRAHLFRLVGIDDVDLWLEGWDLAHRDAPAWRPNDPTVDRLRLARLLRMLLREGVSVAERGLVLEGLDASEGSERDRAYATLDTLRRVRGRLGARALGVRDRTDAVTLSPALEQGLRTGMADARPVWELPRPEAHRLVTALHDWLDAQAGRPEAVVIEDDRIRPFAWRLLADRDVLVLSRKELSHE